MLNPGDFYILASKEAVTVPRPRGGDASLRHPRRRVPRPLRRLLRSRLRLRRHRRHRVAGRPRDPLVRGAVRAAPRPARRPPGLRAADRRPRQALRRRHRSSYQRQGLALAKQFRRDSLSGRNRSRYGTHARVHVEKLPEGVYLATSDEVPGTGGTRAHDAPSHARVRASTYRHS